MDDDAMPNAGPGGDGQDICSFFSSVFAHREHMERLINWLRESQTTCTDSTCFDDINSALPGPDQARLLVDESNHFGGDGQFSLVMLFLVALMTLFALNIGYDRRQQQQQQDQLRKDNNNQDHNRRDGNNNNSSNL